MLFTVSIYTILLKNELLKYILTINSHRKNQWHILQKELLPVNLRDWELLVTLYETENITHAANKLYLSQSTLSSRLKRLEEKFDIHIVLRHRRGISFTPEG